MTDTTAPQVRAHEMAIERDDQRANDLVGRRIGQLLIERVFRNARGRNTYVARRDDGKAIGLKGYEVNRLIVLARRDGVAIR
ncbi:hypothetical protein ACHAAC_06655 [Aeromicrobium sp. CF4.19]|uniref:hypothetical protein n=1 Tax=Aeromicrobium sp. CF4.19 TaxID=3373082 RepID=UPI003EE4962C